MDLKIVCLLFAFVLSLALAQDDGTESETPEGDGSKECRCRHHGGGGRGHKKHWKMGGHTPLKECDEYHKQIFETIKEMKENKEITRDSCEGEDKRDCLYKNIILAIQKSGAVASPECKEQVSKMYGV